MPRKARIVIPKIAHHITQRGNRRQDVFEEAQDFSTYCYWINEYAKKYEVDILAYCLMNNHVHFIMVPHKEDSLAKLFNTVHMRYTQYYNFTRKTNGHLWQGRYFSCALDEAHLFCAIRYVERNPVRADMVDEPWDYPWSSAAWHVGKKNKKYIVLKEFGAVKWNHWMGYLKNNDDRIDAQIRKKTRMGLALADEVFIRYWETKLTCTLRELKAGRPFKK